MSKISLIDMLKSGMHFGHSTSRWHPKMAPYIFGERGGVHIIDLEKTQEMLDRALEQVKTMTSHGGVLLFVGTKSQAKPLVKNYAEACGMPYVAERWLGGTLTNFHQIKESIKRFKMLKDQREKGELRKYTKKEQLMIQWEIEDMEIRLGGIEHMTKVPDALFVVDVRRERTAVKEAAVLGIQVLAICDTNVNPDGVRYVIPANDDSVKTLELLCKAVSDSVKEGKAQAVTTAAKSVAEKHDSTTEPISTPAV